MFGIMPRCALVFAMAAVLLIIHGPHEIEARMTIPQMRNAAKGMAKPCVAKTGVDPALAAGIKDGKLPPDPALQCYLLCIFNQLKVAKDGSINLPMMHKQIDLVMALDIKENAKSSSQICYDNAKSEDDCERCWQFTKCWFESDPASYFLP